MLTFKCRVAIAALIIGASSLLARDGGAPSSPWEVTRLQAAHPAIFPTEECKVIGVQSFFYEGLPFKGQATRVFAYYSTPPGTPPAEGWPAVVCAHGGGGTAYAEWVQRWNAQGFAALAMDLVGGLPDLEKPRAERRRHEFSGPNHIGEFPDIDEPIEDQWMFHAVADVILAHSLLASRPEINPQAIGLMGVSWGGIIANNVAGLDQRFKFVIPVYGCGFLDQGQSGFAEPMAKKMTPAQLEKVRKLWDPKNYLPFATMPMFWLNGNDSIFTFDIWMSSLRLVKVPHVVRIDLTMGHGHKQAWETAEPYRFAASVVNGTDPLPAVWNLQVNSTVATAEFSSAGPVTEAEFVFTEAGAAWQSRKWQRVNAKIEGRTLRAELPTTSLRAGFFRIKDARGSVMTSGLIGPDTALAP